MTQSGKTTLVNSILQHSGVCGYDLREGEGNLSTTTKPTVVEVPDFDIPDAIDLPKSLEEFFAEDWKRPPQKPGRKRISGFKLIDTPGLSDSEGRDPRHVLDIACALRDAGSLSGVVLVLDSNSSFGHLKEGLDYYLRFLDSLRLPLFVVHTKWDSLEKTSKDEEHRKEALQQFLYEITGKGVSCIHFFADLCGWENDEMKQCFSEQFEALKSNSLHALCEHITVHASYFTHEFMVEKPTLFKTVDSTLLETSRSFLKQLDDTLQKLDISDGNVEAKAKAWGIERQLILARSCRLSRERGMLDTDEIIDFNIVEANPKEEKIFCRAPGATSFKLVDIPDGINLENITITNEGVEANIVLTDPKASDEWDSMYSKGALIATGPSSTFYKDRIQELNKKIESLQAEEEEGERRFDTEARDLERKVGDLMTQGAHLDWLLSLLSKPKLSISEYSAFLSYYELHETKKGFDVEHPETLAELLFEKLNQCDLRPVTSEQPILAEGLSFSSQFCEIFGEVSVRGRIFDSPVAVFLAITKIKTDGNRAEENAFMGEKALESPVLQHWCLWLKPEQDPTNIYILGLDATGEGSRVNSFMGRLNRKGEQVYKSSELQFVGAFFKISLEVLYGIVTERLPFSKELVGHEAICDHSQRWVREIIPHLREEGMGMLSLPQALANYQEIPDLLVPVEPEMLFYLKIGTENYLNLNETGIAYWGEKNKHTPYFRKNQATVGEKTEWFLLQVAGPIFSNQFLTRGTMEIRLYVSSEKPSHFFTRKATPYSLLKKDLLYSCHYDLLSEHYLRSPVRQKIGTHYLFCTDRFGIDVAVLEEPVTV